MKSLKYILPILMLSTGVNASVISIFGGQSYEWLEIDSAHTLGQSRSDVEAQLATAAPTSELYGYEYASRSLVEQLFTSYADWDPTIVGNEGYSYEPDIIAGISNLFSDFGTTRDNRIDAYYGATGECGDATQSCEAHLRISENGDGYARVHQSKAYGWDSAYASVAVVDKFDNLEDVFSSFLVRRAFEDQGDPLPSGGPAVVPLPAAAWLFGSALLGFFGFSRRKANA